MFFISIPPIPAIIIVSISPAFIVLSPGPNLTSIRSVSPSFLINLLALSNDSGLMSDAITLEAIPFFIRYTGINP